MDIWFSPLICYSTLTFTSIVDFFPHMWLANNFPLNCEFVHSSMILSPLKQNLFYRSCTSHYINGIHSLTMLHCKKKIDTITFSKNIISGLNITYSSKILRNRLWKSPRLYVVQHSNLHSICETSQLTLHTTIVRILFIRSVRNTLFILYFI